MADPHTNFGYSTIATAPSPASSGTSLVVQAGDGAKFPSTGAFNATVWPAATQPTTANAEIVRVTAISTDTFTIIRTQESTSARAIVIGDQIADTITVKTLTDVELNVYVTDQNKTIPATTQVILDDYLEVAASFFYELSTDAILVIGDFATPLPAPDQSPNIFVTSNNELVPSNSEVVFSDFYELSAPFVSELGNGAEMQLGVVPDIGSASPYLPGYEIGYDQITAGVFVLGTTQATGTTIITCNPHYFDGSPVLVEFFSSDTQLSIVANGGLGVTLNENGAAIADLAFVRAGVATTPQPFVAVWGVMRFTPTAGYHSYVVTSYTASTSGSPAIGAGTGTAGGATPAYIRFTKV